MDRIPNEQLDIIDNFSRDQFRITWENSIDDVIKFGRAQKSSSVVKGLEMSQVLKDRIVHLIENPDEWYDVRLW